ncbi:TPA: hypothetical protein RUW98_002988 [Aeromonas veronii]|nr:hypothetical protein [Aeromonas veronii]
MKRISLKIKLFLVSMLFISSSHADISEPEIIAENVYRVFPGNHLSPAYFIREGDNNIFKIERDGITNTGVIGKDVVKILSTDMGDFAALTSTGNVLINKGDQNTSMIIPGIIDLQMMKDGFVALRSNGTVVTWNDQISPFQCQTNLNNIKRVITHPFAYGFVALHGDGSVSSASLGYDTCNESPTLNTDVIDVAVGVYGFTILDKEGNAYQYQYYVGPGAEEPIDQEKNVSHIISGLDFGISVSKDHITCMPRGGSALINTKGSLTVAAAFGTGIMMLPMSDGSVSQAHCHNSNLNEQSQTTLKSLANIKSVISNYSGFAAIDTVGDVFTWGGYSDEYNNEQLETYRHDVVSVIPMLNSFAALKIDGSVIAWGDHMSIKYGSQNKLRNITGIYPSAGQFLALSKSGTLYMFD